MPRRPGRRRFLPALIFLGIPLIILGMGVGVLVHYYRADKAAAAAALATVEETQTEGTQAERIVRRVGELMVLPDERPDVAEITNADGLRDKPFFAHAKNGDNVLIYAQAHKIIVYDPVAHKIVDVGMLSADTQ